MVAIIEWEDDCYSNFNIDNKKNLIFEVVCDVQTHLEKVIKF